MNKSKYLKQWELPNYSKVKLPNGEFATFIKMDGMYGKWDIGGKMVIGNYLKFKKAEGYYEVVVVTDQ